jgi:hypothetical protein
LSWHPGLQHHTQSLSVLMLSEVKSSAFVVAKSVAVSDMMMELLLLEVVAVLVFVRVNRRLKTNAVSIVLKAALGL